MSQTQTDIALDRPTPVSVGQTFVGSPVNLWFKLPFILGPVNTSFTYTVTDTGFPAGNSGNRLTSLPAINP